MQGKSLKTLAVFGLLVLPLAGVGFICASLYTSGTEETVILDTTMWDDSSVSVNLNEGKQYHLTVKRVTEPEKRKNLSYLVYVEKKNDSLNVFDSGSGYMDFTLGKEYTWTFTPDHGGDCYLWIVNNVRTLNFHTTQFQVTLSVGSP